MTRCCLMVRRKNLASQALAMAARWIARHRPETRLISYSDASHKGSIYAAANWTPTPVQDGGRWRSGLAKRATVRWQYSLPPRELPGVTP
jgi:hypothetical protein